MALRKVKRPELKGEKAFNERRRKERSLENKQEKSMDVVTKDDSKGPNEPYSKEDFLSKYSLSNIRLLKSADYLNSLLQELEDKNKLSLLITAVNMVAKEGERKALFSALMEYVRELPSSMAIEIFDSTEPICESLVPGDLLLELEHTLNVGKAEERGFLYDEKKNRYFFNANVFARHFLKRSHARSTIDGRLFLYSQKGVYEELSEVSLGKLIREVMHEGIRNSWKSTYETEIFKVLQRESRIVGEMDTKRNFINVRNGMVDLSTYRLVEHSPEFNSTVQIPIYYDIEALAPKFEKFMRDITLNDEELVAVHQELIGYWLTGETKAEKAVYYYGSGANGKSVLASVVTELVGSQNVSSVPLSQFNDPFGMESMIGKSLNISAENEMGGKALKTENFKAIVSGDKITINIKYRSAISYRPYCRLVFLVNNLPDSSDVTAGYFRKVMIVPFSRTFKSNEQNVDLKDELLKELPGIFTWALIGLKRLRNNNYKFSACKAIEETERTYKDEQNPVREFFHSHVALEEGARTKQSDFYSIYTQWLQIQGIDDKGTKSRQVFWRYFKVILDNEDIPIVKKKVKGSIYFDGVKIRDKEVYQHNSLNGTYT